MPPCPCLSICLPAARAISHDCVTLASMTSRKSSAFWSTIFDTLLLAGCDHQNVDAAEFLDRRLDDRVAVRLGAGAHGDDLGLAAELLAFGGDLLQLGGIAGRKHDIGAGAGEHLRGQRAERAGRAGDDRGLAADIEQRERDFSENLRTWISSLGHSVRAASGLRCGAILTDRAHALLRLAHPAPRAA